MDQEEIFALDTAQKSQGLSPMDFNDDGLLDIVIATVDEDEPTQYSASAFVNTGFGWKPSPGIAATLESRKVAFATSAGKGTGISTPDINGDGVGDLLTSVEGGSGNRLALSNSLRSGKLVRSTSTLGEVNEIAWTVSTRFNNRASSGKELLPLAMPVVARHSKSDGRGTALVTDISYASGLYTDRSFRGFGWVEQKPSSGLRSELVFYQDEERMARPIQSSAFDSSGKLRVRITTDIQVRQDHDFVRQVQLFSTDTERFDHPGDTHTQIVNYYNDRIQITRTVKDPDVSTAGDEGTMTTDWLRNDDAGIWELQSRNRILDSDNNLMAETITLFDGLPEGNALFGLPSESREYVGPGEYVSRSFAYDPFGNPVLIRDRTGAETVVEYDEATSTFRVKSVDAEGLTRRSEYDPRFGLLIRDVNASGHATVTTYDSFGRMSKVVAPGDESSVYGTTSFDYSDLGDPGLQFIHMRVTENAGTGDVYESTTLFDGAGKIYESHKEGPDGQTIMNLVEFDAGGKPRATSMPFYVGDTPVMATTERDDLGRSTRIEDSLGQVTRVQYRGRFVDVADARGSNSTWVSDTDGNLEQIRLEVDGETQLTNYHYDVLGRLVRVVDALGYETRIRYDGLGRRTLLEDPNAGTFHYRYDGEGRLVEQIGPEGGSTRLRYSAAGDLLEKELPDGTVQKFRYGGSGAPNAAGRILQVEDTSGILELEYDERGNVVERRRTVDSQTYVTGFTYDSMDRVRQVIYPDGFTAYYNYDEGNNLAAIVDGDGRPLADRFEYNAAGRITDFEFGNGVSSAFDYDDLARMVSSRTSTGSGLDIQELIYAFDAANNVTSLDDTISGASQQFEYDEAGRLTLAQGPYGEEAYEYDAIGNLLRKGNLRFSHDPQYPQRVSCGAVLGGNKGEAKGKSRNSAIDPCVASLVSVDLEQVDRAFAVNYDGRGNVVQKGSRSFEYDGENRLLRVRESNGRVIEENRYDASGELVVKATQSETRVFIDGLYEEGQSHVSRHIYAGPLLVATLVVPRSQVSLIKTASASAESFYNRAGFSVAAALLLLLLAVDRYFGWYVGRALAGIGAACRGKPVNALMVLMIVMSSWPTAALAGGKSGDGDGEKRYYYHANHLGSVNVVTDDDGKVTARRDYRPFGEQQDWSGAQAGPRELLNTFQGQKFDDTTGLYHFKARHYDAELGRFMSADTVVAGLDDPRTLHRYAFAGGNPVKFVDPSGRSFFSAIGDAFSSAAEWVADNAVEILTIVAISAALVALTVFTGGLGTAILVGAAVGFAAGGLIATAAGYSVTDSEFWITAGVGAGIGALVGATWYLPSTSALLKAGASKWAIGGQLAVEGALTGAVIGGTEGVIAGAVSGASVEETLRLVNQGAVIGGLIGAVAGPLGFGVKGAGSAGKALVYFAKAGSIGKVAFAGFASADTKRPTTLSLTGGVGDGNQYFFSGAERRAKEAGEAIKPVGIVIGLGIADGLLTLQGYPDLITYPSTF
jgi:RHS repeat-associated protein